MRHLCWIIALALVATADAHTSSLRQPTPITGWIPYVTGAWVFEPTWVPHDTAVTANRCDVHDRTGHGHCLQTGGSALYTTVLPVQGEAALSLAWTDTATCDSQRDIYGSGGNPAICRQLYDSLTHYTVTCAIRGLDNAYRDPPGSCGPHFFQLIDTGFTSGWNLLARTCAGYVEGADEVYLSHVTTGGYAECVIPFGSIASTLGDLAYYTFRWNGQTLEGFVEGHSRCTVAAADYVSPSVTTPSNDMHLIGNLGTGTAVTWDDCWVDTNGAWDDSSIVWAHSCNLDGSKCQCSGHDYLDAGRHFLSGGPVTGVLPDCDQAGPVYLTTTTSSTSTSTSTIVTTTSTSSTTTTSVAPTTSTSVTTTTSTSSTTSTTTAGNGPNWSGETAAVGCWHMNENFDSGDPAMADTCGSNDLTDSCSGQAKETTTVFEGGNALSNNSGVPNWNLCKYYCNDGVNCTKSDFYFGAQPASNSDVMTDFTCYMWVHPNNDNDGRQQMLGGQNGAETLGGWSLYWDSAASPAKFKFRMRGCLGGSCAGSSDDVTVTSTTDAPVDNDYFVAIQYNAAGNELRISVNGEAWATATTFDDNAWSDTLGSDLTLGGNADNALKGYWDFAGCWSDDLTIESVRHIAVCGETGSDCTCSGTTYTSCIRHTASGGCGDSTGIIAGTMTDCNQSAPGYE